jgi:nitroimidazol reductase NimA-like FMN-containing flavoprotein (pyridoxamine 5'-phosphate oxidase superfamily)
MEIIEKMKELVRAKVTCVLATVSGGEPHCSLMAYAHDDDCTEIYMATYKDTRKYRNIRKNPLASLLIDTRDEHPKAGPEGTKALTVAGSFLEMEGEDRKETALARLLLRHPRMGEFFGHPETEILCFRIQSFLLLEGLEKAHFETL